jgi:hypothetical protein
VVVPKPKKAPELAATLMKIVFPHTAGNIIKALSM